MFARGDLLSPPSTYVVPRRSPGRRHPLDDGIMRVTAVCDWRGARADVRTRRCRRELLGHIMVISPYGDQTLPLESADAAVESSSCCWLAGFPSVVLRAVEHICAVIISNLASCEEPALLCPVPT